MLLDVSTSTYDIPLDWTEKTGKYDTQSARELKLAAVGSSVSYLTNCYARELNRQGTLKSADSCTSGDGLSELLLASNWLRRDRRDERLRRVIFGELLSLSTSQLVALELYQQLVADRLAQTLKYHSFLGQYSFDMVNSSRNGNMYASRNRYKRGS